MDIPIRFGGPGNPVSWLTVGMGHKPGDPPPVGYVDRSEWADVQVKAGLKQVKCGICSLWKFPQQLSGRTVTQQATTRKNGGGRQVTVTSPVCLKCVAAKPE